MDNIVIGTSPHNRFLAVDGPRVWVCYPNSRHQGWDFGAPGSSPVYLPDMTPHKLHPNGAVLWDTALSRVRDKVTGEVVFQLPKGYRKPVDVQWSGQYLVARFTPTEMLILDLGYVLPQ